MLPEARPMLIEAAALVVFRGESLVLDELDLTIGDGDAVVLHGSNGTGKSTLLRVLAGLVRPAGGSLTWDKIAVSADLPSHARRIALLGDRNAIKPGLTVIENLRFPARLSGRATSEIMTALEALGIAPLADLPARMLSQGQLRRLALARIMLSRAQLMLLDEPGLGLDAEAIDRLGVMLDGHRARGGAVVAATHQALPLAGALTLSLGTAAARE